MRWHRVMAVLAGAAAVWCVAPLAAGGAAVAGRAVLAAAHGVTLAGVWGRATEVPGLGSLNKGGFAQVNSVSCPSAGNCAAGGFYLDGSGHRQAFVASERNGAGGRAIKVPGTATLNAGGVAQVNSVSCPSAGNCAAGGNYMDGFFHQQAFVASQRNGAWGRAIEVPGTAALNAGVIAEVLSVSCASAGNCVAGGDYRNGFDRGQAFVASQRNGAWGRAIEVPGTAALNASGDARVFSVSCPSAGNCSAGGFYLDASSPTGRGQAFVVSERNGAWGKAVEVPGTGTLNKGGDARVSSVSCASAGNCAAGGNYVDGSGHFQGFVVSQRNGAWGKAVEVPGTGTLNAGGNAVVNSVSCPSAGNCAAGGFYRDGSGHFQAFVASQRNGAWGRPIEVPRSGTLNMGGLARVSSVSCPSAGNCAAGGFYRDGSGHFQAFVASERNGAWGRGIEVPGSAALNAGGVARVSSVSCAPAGYCAAGGLYTDGSAHAQGFVVSQE